MIVVKYFHEEPAALEILVAEEAPDARGAEVPRSLESFLSSPKYYRGYLTASDLGSGVTGATALSHPEVWSVPLGAVLVGGSARAQESVWINEGAGAREGSLEAVLLSAAVGTVVVVGTSTGAATPTLVGEIRDHNRVIREILDAGDVLLRAEPAHDGVDWALYAAQPLADRITAAFQVAPSTDGVARFVIPQRMARGEHKFYFERYDLDLFAAYRV